jgi:hypothetical protein
MLQGKETTVPSLHQTQTHSCCTTQMWQKRGGRWECVVVSRSMKEAFEAFWNPSCREKQRVYTPRYFLPPSAGSDTRLHARTHAHTHCCSDYSELVFRFYDQYPAQSVITYCTRITTSPYLIRRLKWLQCLQNYGFVCVAVSQWAVHTHTTTSNAPNKHLFTQ